jgi:hypothetical protein
MFTPKALKSRNQGWAYSQHDEPPDHATKIPEKMLSEVGIE